MNAGCASETVRSLAIPECLSVHGDVLYKSAFTFTFRAVNCVPKMCTVISVLLEQFLQVNGGLLV